ncbi:MAG: hypothetical protein LBF19_05875, partial [Prevotellaceae bacterium]|nr:hypothetical protein [Prevotellaceae bacterium]
NIDSAGYSFTTAELTTVGAFTYYREVHDNTCNAGVWSRSAGSYELTVPSGCPYTGSDLYQDASHLCQQRSGGAQNWEAWIKDARDNELYRIVQFSDCSWWFAEDLRISNVGATCNGLRWYDGTNKPSCPSGWELPTLAQADDRYLVSGLNDPYGDSMILTGPSTSSECKNIPRFEIILKDCTNTRVYVNYGAPVVEWNCYSGSNCNNISCTSVVPYRGRGRCVQ